MRTSDVQTHVGRIAAIEAVAVDAALKLGILYQRTLIERGKVALVDTHLTPDFVAWRDESVAQAIVDAIGADIKRERAISVPSIVEFGRDGDAERVATILTE